MFSIDLNCDMGEFTDEASIARDAALMDYVSSVNIACGGHAGDEATMRRTVENAIAKSVAIGGHPGYDDRQNFGRVALSLSDDEIFDLVSHQVWSLKKITEELGGKLHHVKPHGALYNQAAKDLALAEMIARAVTAVDPTLILYGLSGSYLISEAEKLGLKTASEVFADRTYQADGSLTPRIHPNALITDVAQSLAQTEYLTTNQRVATVTGETISLKAETICIHGDGEHALEFARAINEFLTKKNIRILARKTKKNLQGWRG
jgi:UPF0271 protein